MAHAHAVSFGPFRLDAANARLWRGEEAVRISPKALAVLHYLVEHSGQLVTKDELFAAVWPEVVVGDAALTICIGELRKVLGESAKAPQYIETVHTRGYRFLKEVRSEGGGGRREGREQAAGSQERGAERTEQSTLPPPRSSSAASLRVGRATELAQLHRLFARARDGERQVVFVTGEPGIGKTTLVETFLEQLGSEREIQIGRGQCLELHGVGEPYLPLLEALGRVGRQADGERLIAVLWQYAPSWLAQLPALLSGEERDTLQRQVQGVTRERMLREIAEALEALTAVQPLVLVLEDLHWSDPSTLDCIAMMARRREPARLLILGTYRPSEGFAREHPLRVILPELLGHRQCKELPLEGFSEGAIKEYLDTRFPVQVFPTRFVQVLEQRTEGNPLFLVNLIDELIRQELLTNGEGGWMVHGDIDALVQQIPESSRQLISAQMTRVSSTSRQTLATASIAGAVFSAAAVAAALETAIAEIEICCEEIVQQHIFLQRAGIEAWPDGTMAARYGFRHALYQELWHEQGTINQRREWHRRIGLRKEAAYNGRVQEVAAELAVHFEQGRDPQRAIQYYQHAASTATERHAYQEAITHFTAALSLLQSLPQTPARHEQELQLQTSLHWMLARSRGEAAPELDGVVARERELLQLSEETPQLFGAVFSLFDFYLVRGELASVRFFAEYELRLARRFPEQPFLGLAYFMLGCPDFLAGELPSARTALEQAMAIYAQPPTETSILWETGLCCFPFAALTLWHLGFPDQALYRAAEAITSARLCETRFLEAYGLNILAAVQELRGDVAAVWTHATAALQVAEVHGFAPMRAMGRIYQGWALSRQEDGHEGAVQLRQAIADLRSTSGETFRTYYLALLAEACGRAGQIEAGLSVLVEALALVDKNGERWYEAEIYRLKGELLLQKGKRDRERGAGSLSPQAPSLKPQDPKEMEQEAEEYFVKAIGISRKQHAKSLELRAVISLARLWQQQALLHEAGNTEQGRNSEESGVRRKEHEEESVKPEAGGQEYTTRNTQHGLPPTQHEAHSKLNEAHQMLSEIYDWFTEGFDTKDLQEAKALLGELHG